MTPRRAIERDISEIAPQSFIWEGQTGIAFETFEGTLYFDAVAQDQDTPGFDTLWLRQQNLFIRYRSGGERLKLAPNRPTKSVKYHYQAMDIPAWERPVLPVVGTANTLLFAAGIGMDCAHQQMQGERVSLRWQPTPAPTTIDVKNYK